MEKILRIINSIDPESLLIIGAPSDEYLKEAKLITDNIACFRGEPDFHAVYLIIKSVFESQFGKLSGSEEKYLELAKCIYELISLG